MHMFTNIHIYVEYRCIYVSGILKGITGPDSLLSPAPVSAKQSILKPLIQISMSFLFPRPWILFSHLHPFQECVQTLPASGTGHPDATETLLNMIQDG